MNRVGLLIVVGLFSVTAGGVMALGKDKPVPAAVTSQMSSMSVQPPLKLVPPPPPPEESASSVAIPGAIAPPPALIQIQSCNGQPGSANFRSAPSLAPGVVMGVIEQGEWVSLRGDRAFEDGVEWIRVQDSVGRMGWIAACFEGR